MNVDSGQSAEVLKQYVNKDSTSLEVQALLHDKLEALPGQTKVLFGVNPITRNLFSHLLGGAAVGGALAGGLMWLSKQNKSTEPSVK
jgi:hypothetical protein